MYSNAVIDTSGQVLIPRPIEGAVQIAYKVHPPQQFPSYNYELMTRRTVKYTLNSVVSHLWQPKVHMTLHSFVVLTWMCDTIELM